MAQRQRAWLITTRSYDRNVSPGEGLLDHNRAQCFTGVAQRLARGAHNPEVRCSNHLAGISHLSALQKPMVMAHGTINMSALLSLTPLAQRKERQAHNLEDVRSKRTGGILTGVAQRLARGAHNSEVRCSNHLAGISLRRLYRRHPSRC